MTSPHGENVVGVIGTSRDENNAFIYLTRHFTRRQLNVPRIIAVSDDAMRYLQTDLGSLSLYDAIGGGRKAGGRYNVKERALLVSTIRELPNIQIRGARGLDFSHCYPQPVFDEAAVLFDLNYFKYCFLKATGLDFHELKLEADFHLFARDLTSEQSESFMYRDFQARNVMIGREGKPFFIDYQGGREGPYYYDVASFLWQASAKYPYKLRRELVYEYYEALKSYTEVPSSRHFVHRLSLFVLFRTLQVLGAYGFRGYFEKKKYFTDSIPPAIANLRELVKLDCFPYPYMMGMLRRLADMPQFTETTVHATTRADGYKTATRNIYPAHPLDGPATFSRYDNKGPLVVRVYSFSYQKGIPRDETGNGGGYVFDCRATHNPGRYEPYKLLTGLDEPVIRFLEDDGEILVFLESVYKLADMHVRRYIQRGFTSLMFAFGCTGGQHRSVYCAQHLAEHINSTFGVEVRITHREQGISSTLPRQTVRQAMILAAGLGTRLKPLTDTTPKALITVGGQTLLERLMERLRQDGVERIVINVHHLADKIKEYLAANDNFGLDIRISDESDMLLDTGGGIKRAASLFIPDTPILIHNVDIISNANLRQLYAAMAPDDDALLLVSRRKTRRCLLFNDDMRLVGWMNKDTGETRSPYPDLRPDACRVYAFSGIHVFSPRLFKLMNSFGDAFGIMDFYLGVCRNAVICGVIDETLRLTDVGKPETLARAREEAGGE